MTQTIETLTHEVVEIMMDLETNSLTLECCDFKIHNTMVTHCYYNPIDDTLIFTSGDMENDDYAEELILTNEQTIELLNLIIECYN